MKKLFFLMLCAGIGFGVRAQTTQTDKEKKAEMKDLRGDVRAHKEAKHKENKDWDHLRVSKAMHDHKAVRRINKDESADSKRLKSQGVDHATAKAKRQVKVQDDNRKDHTQ